MRTGAAAGAEGRGPDAGLGLGRLLLIIVTACLLLANLYYPQPVLRQVAGALHLPESASGTVITAGQLGYIAGLLLVAPLGDRLENRRLCAAMALAAAVSALAGSCAPTAPLFLGSIFLMGVFATATQVLVVFASALAGPGRSGAVLGILACGLFLGIALARPVASLVTGLTGWRWVYAGSAAALAVTAASLWRFLPALAPPQTGAGYRAILRSMARLTRSPRLLRRTAISAGAFFSFSVFWSSLPLFLATRLPATGGVTAFALAGLVTPPCMLLVGRLLDRGRGQALLLSALGCVALAWGIVFLEPAGLGVALLAALLLDPASCAVTVSIQQRILADAPAGVRGRLNSLNISLNFLGGAAGAALGPWLLARYGLPPVALGGASLLLLLPCLAATVWREVRTPSPPRQRG